MAKQQSATSRLKELTVVFILSAVAIAVVMTYATSWFDAVGAISWLFSVIIDYPTIGGMLVGIPIFIYILARVRDFFAPR